MLCERTVAVVVPAFNEETQIGKVIDSMPSFVDRIVIVNDCSRDQTSKVVRERMSRSAPSSRVIEPDSQPIVPTPYNKADVVARALRFQNDQEGAEYEVYTVHGNRSRIVLLEHVENGSVGTAIATGYRWCREHQIDCVAVMAGDGQMDPSELYGICFPVVSQRGIDYVKGNRLSHPAALEVVPPVRYFGNSILSLLTKIASGYWRVSDTQTGFTAISCRALNAIDLHRIYPSYGCPNDILVKLNIANCKVAEVPIKPIYEVGEQSKMKVLKVIPRISLLLMKSFFVRLYRKYFVRDFHPLFLSYHLSFLLLILDLPFFYDVLLSLHPDIRLPMQSLVIFFFITVSGLQLLLFSMWMDMLDNESLQENRMLSQQVEYPGESAGEVVQDYVA